MRPDYQEPLIDSKIDKTFTCDEVNNLLEEIGWKNLFPEDLLAIRKHILTCSNRSNHQKWPEEENFANIPID